MYSICNRHRVFLKFEISLPLKYCIVFLENLPYETCSVFTTDSHSLSLIHTSADKTHAHTSADTTHALTSQKLVLDTFKHSKLKIINCVKDRKKLYSVA